MFLISFCAVTHAMEQQSAHSVIEPGIWGPLHSFIARAFFEQDFYVGLHDLKYFPADRRRDLWNQIKALRQEQVGRLMVRNKTGFEILLSIFGSDKNIPANIPRYAAYFSREEVYINNNAIGESFLKTAPGTTENRHKISFRVCPAESQNEHTYGDLSVDSQQGAMIDLVYKHARTHSDPNNELRYCFERKVVLRNELDHPLHICVCDKSADWSIVDAVIKPKEAVACMVVWPFRENKHFDLLDFVVWDWQSPERGISETGVPGAITRGDLTPLKGVASCLAITGFERNSEGNWCIVKRKRSLSV